MNNFRFKEIISKLRIPVIQAPMAGGINNMDFVIKFANAGGIGSFGFGYTNASDVEITLREANVKTVGKSGFINANFFIFPSSLSLPNQSAVNRAKAAIALNANGNDFLPKSIAVPFYPDLNECLEAVWKAPPSLLTFHFGVPSTAQVAQAHARNILVGVTVTTAAEAWMAHAAGADFVVAQGAEAGGHRGSFSPEAAGDRERLPTGALVESIRRDGPDLPVVAAGGVMTGQHIADMLAAGATAVQMGTAFLVCDESSASAAHKRCILNEHSRGTVYSSAFSGRPAQCLATSFTAAMADAPKLPFPLQNTMTGPMRRAAAERDDAELQGMYTGSNYRLARAMPVQRLMQLLRTEWEAAAVR